ncbi:hypothetical protein HHK36_032109 [Tetracentron sinense]|uniref:Uncharacterized protein n=1 Tax=Tetracentron sinense TaxID=13715 RepID=A0A834Y7W4_TETSI|nr:hypothetical protein HHK36_032109 [Tetracentron sinense]
MEMDPELDAKKEYYLQPQDAIASDIDSIPLMPVELAIKRELAYRRKVEMLRLQQRTDFKKSPMRSQGSPSSPSLVGIKRKALIGNPQCFPAPHPRPSYSYQPNLVCKVCQVVCSSVYDLKQHCEGKKHSAKLKELEESWRNCEKKVSKPKWCKVCRISCINELSLEQHLIGKEHAACLQAIEDAKRVREKDGEAAKVKWEELEWEMVP